MIGVNLRLYGGGTLSLPALSAWSVSLAMGEPCDALEMECPYDGSLEAALKYAVGFSAFYDGKVVLNGLVDEYSIRRDLEGTKLSVSGRGMAALLLDNECPATEYVAATLEDVLRNHAEPYGLELAAADDMPPVEGYCVRHGDSQWDAVSDFCRFAAGIRPRVDRTGKLVICAQTPGRATVSLGAHSPVESFSYTQRRYGVISKITVRDSSTGKSSVVENEDFAAAGGCCERVYSTSLRNSYMSADYLGRYQIEESTSGWRSAEIVLPGLFSAFPGDMLVLSGRTVGNGTYEVREAESSFGKNGSRCRLGLREV